MALFGPDPRDPAISRIEAKLDAIIRHLGIEVPDVVSPRVRQAVEEGRTIEAIKLYREETGAGLREAKDMIESLT